MSITVMRMMLCLGMLGHALNMYCDRIISIFPNGVLKLSNMKEIKKEGFLANLMKGVFPKIPMRSGILGVLSLVLQYLAYFSFAEYVTAKRRFMESSCSFAARYSAFWEQGCM